MLLVAIVLVVAAIVVLLVRRADVDDERSVPIYLLDDGTGNESLIVEGAVGGDDDVLFLVDTAYAGAPVLSLSYLDYRRKRRAGGASRGRRAPWAVLPSFSPAAARATRVARRFRRTMRDLGSSPSTYDLHEALNEFSATSGCRAYTSGCTMRLMGIGATSEAQSDMFLCPPIDLPSVVPSLPRSRWDADVLVTNRLDGSPHILTCDYLLHRGPVLIEPRRGRMTFGTRARPSAFDMFAPEMVGGAFVVPVLVGGATVQAVVDTGAATTLSISRSVARRLSTCAPRGETVHQSGVNGERVCSDVVMTEVTLGSTRLVGVRALVNATDVEGADGYLGIGVLRAFDLYLSHDGIGVRPNGLPVGDLAFAVRGTCDGVDVCASNPGEA